MVENNIIQKQEVASVSQPQKRKFSLWVFMKIIIILLLFALLLYLFFNPNIIASYANRFFDYILS